MAALESRFTLERRALHRETRTRTPARHAACGRKFLTERIARRNRIETTLDTSFDDALVYAADAHRTQRRKGSNVPYIGHLLGVASIVIDNGGNEDEVISALLHDVAEDQGGQPRLDDVHAKFGARVAAIVEACSDSLTEDPEVKDPWLERKQAYLRHLAEGTDPSVFLVSAADKLHNLRSMLADYAIDGEKLWTRFNSEAGKVRIIQYYRSLLAAYQRVRDERVTHVASALERTLSELEDACGASTLPELAGGKGLI